MALIPYADESDWPAELRERALELPIGNLVGMLANAPALVGPVLRLGGAILTESKFEPVLRELAILRTAALTGSEYEWVQHVAIARRLEIEDAKVDALEAGSVREGPFDDRESLVLEIVEEAVGGTPRPELVQRAERELGRTETVELILTVGYYSMLGCVMRATEIDLDDPAT